MVNVYIVDERTDSEEMEMYRQAEIRRRGELHRHIRTLLEDNQFEVNRIHESYLESFNILFEYNVAKRSALSSVVTALNFFRSFEFENRIHERKLELMNKLVEIYSNSITHVDQDNPFKVVIDTIKAWLNESVSDKGLEQKLLCLLEPRSNALDSLLEAEKLAGYHHSHIRPMSDFLYVHVKQRSGEEYIYSRSEEMRAYMGGGAQALLSSKLSA